jgi:hypothetical protein
VPIRFDCLATRQIPAAIQDALAALVRDPVIPAVVPRSGVGARADRLLLQALWNADRYALTTLYSDADLDAFDPRMSVVDRLGHGANSPRGGSGVALALATTIATGVYDVEAIGVPLARATEVAVWLVTSYACAHAATDPTGWGAGSRPLTRDLHDWPSPLWAGQLGIAAWLLWSQLRTSDRYAVAVMVVNEADRIARVPPPSFAAPDGRILYPGDTKAEENAWLGTVLSVASAMMPTHPHAALWRQAEAAYEVAAYATQADTTSAAVLNGRTLDTWLTGWNAHADGTVTNHGTTPHPDYMTNVSMNLTNAAVDALGDRATLRTAVHNADLVYGALTQVPFPSPPYRAPGGTIYRPGQSGIHYPWPNDWGTALIANFVVLDAAVAALGLHPSAEGYLLAHTRALLAMQARSADGSTYRDAREFKYPQREQWVAEQLAHAWLIRWAAAGDRIRFTDEALD